MERRSTCSEIRKFGMSSSGCESRPGTLSPTTGKPALRRQRRRWRRCVGRQATEPWVVSLEMGKLPGVQGFTPPEDNSSDTAKMGEVAAHPAGWLTTARSKRTAQQPGRPSSLCVSSRATGPGDQSRHGVMTPAGRVIADAHVFSPSRSIRSAVGRTQRAQESRPKEPRESEDRIRAMRTGNGQWCRTRRSKGGPCWK